MSSFASPSTPANASVPATVHRPSFVLKETTQKILVNVRGFLGPDLDTASIHQKDIDDIMKDLEQYKCKPKEKSPQMEKSGP